MTDETKPVRACSASPAEEDGLPPLPNPILPATDLGIVGRTRDYYSSDQMRAYAQAALSNVQPKGTEVASREALRNAAHKARIVACGAWSNCMRDGIQGFEVLSQVASQAEAQLTDAIDALAAAPSPAPGDGS